ncbi:MAG: magnesium transporter [Planctomycetota bacterium]|nr:magnesium transporter [Planctomycetota bacterium]
MAHPDHEEKSLSGFQDLLRSSTTQASGYLKGVHAADRAEWLLAALPEDAWRVFSDLSTEDKAELLEHAEDELRRELVDRMSAGDLRDLVEEMPSDEAVDLLEEADDRLTEDVLAAIPADIARELRELSAYDSDTAGGLMATEFITVSPTEHIGDAVKAIRKQGEDADEELSVFVVNDQGRPLGFLTDRILLSQPIHTPVQDAMVVPFTIEVHADKEDVGRLVEKYGLNSLGVVDSTGLLIGVISAEDATEVRAEEAEEDLLRLVGASPDSLHARPSVARQVRARLPLMGITILSGLLSAKVLRMFLEGAGGDPGPSDILRYLPLIIGLAGNVGVQSSTVLVRAMALGELEGSRQRAMLRRETSVGLSVGAICGALITLVVMWLEPGRLGLAVGIATLIAVAFSAVLGTSVPVACQKVGIDPAIVAGPFLICLSDIAGSVLFVVVAKALLTL